MAHGVAVMIKRQKTITTAMSRQLTRLAMLWCLVMLAGFAQASALTSLDYVALPGNQLQLQLTFDGAAPETRGYSIEKPARISIDLLGATSSLKNRRHSLGSGNARSVTVVQARNRTRLVINLNQVEGYKVKAHGNRLLITLGVDGTPSNDPAAPRPHAATAATNAIANVDFHRSKEGGGDVVIDLSNTTIPVDVKKQGNKVVVRFSNTQLPAKLQRRLDVTDFGTAVTYVDAKMSGDDTLVTITPKGDWGYLAYQADNVFTINVKAKKAQAKSTDEKAFRYTGKKLSLNFQNIKVRSVLQLIADFTKLNLVASDSVTGSITLRLKNVPWDQALDLILKTKGLAKRKVGNVLMVAPADEMAAREQARLQSKQKHEQLVPLKSEFFSINYAKAADLAALLKGKGGFLSDRGRISVDQRTNMLIVQDTAKRLDTIRDLITTLDVPVQQVLIEARVVIASNDAANAIGVRWGGNQAQSFNSGNDSLNFGSDFGSAGGTAGTPSDMVVDLGVTGPGSTHFSLGFFHGSSSILQLELSALDSEGKAQLVATPKVLTADQQTAVIASGQEIPYSTASDSGTNVEFKDAELKLEVTPHITPDGRVIMDIKVNDDSVGQMYSGVPSIDTHRVETSVLVDNGETVVLGGIFQRQKRDQVIKTPFLGDLPWIGNLFRKTVKSDSKQQLMIFITPRLIKKGA